LIGVNNPPGDRVNDTIAGRVSTCVDECNIAASFEILDGGTLWKVTVEANSAGRPN
jgi:hypothetical protein